jgi:uncharacterized protein
MPSPPNAQPLRVRLRQALTTAMRARDAVAVSALRSTLGAIDNAEAVDANDVVPIPRSPGGVIAGAVPGLGAGEVTRRQLSEDGIAGIVRAEVADREWAAADYERAGRGDRADRLRAEAAVLAAHIDGPTP